MKPNFELVFVHLGTAKASHLWANIDGILKTWPEIVITLVSETKANLKSQGLISFDGAYMDFDGDLDNLQDL
jgi:hypothetical protein